MNFVVLNIQICKIHTPHIWTSYLDSPRVQQATPTHQLVVHSCSVMPNSVTPWTAARQASLSITNSRACSNSCQVSDAIHPSHPLSHPLLLPSIFPSIRVFSNELVLLIKWPKCWSFSFSISLSNEHSGLISFRIDWFDLVVQGTLESSPTLQFKSINSSVLSFLYGPTLTSIHLYMTTGKTIALTI